MTAMELRYIIRSMWILACDDGVMMVCCPWTLVGGPPAGRPRAAGRGGSGEGRVGHFTTILTLYSPTDSLFQGLALMRRYSRPAWPGVPSYLSPMSIGLPLSPTRPTTRPEAVVSPLAMPQAGW